MKILIVCSTMTSISGSPMYNYTLALELQKMGHLVAVYSMWEDNELRNNLAAHGIMTFYSEPQEDCDLIIISQKTKEFILDKINAKFVINVVHSEYECETPIISEKVNHYVVIRPEIKDHLIAEHKIPEEKISVIYNGLDFERFNYGKRKINNENYIKVVLPCTLDMLRKDFIEYYTKQANEKYRVFIYGTDYKNKIFTNEFCYIHEAVFDIENYIADADIVAGILLGRVNLEARAMGIISYIHNPADPFDYKVYYPKSEVFFERHDIKNVAKKIIDLVKI